MSVPQSDSPADNCSSLSRLLFSRRAANYKLFSLPKLVLIGLEGDPRASLPHLLHNKAPDGLLERTVAVCCVFHFLNTKCSISSPLLLLGSLTAWAALLLTGVISDLIATGPLYRPWQRDICHSILLYSGMPSKSRSRSGRIKLLLHLGSMSILAAFTHSSNLCHNKTDIYKNLSHLY